MDLKFFTNEINSIKDIELKDVARRTILKADNFYNTIPSSTSGLYHPVDELGDRGKIIHMKKCFHLSSQCARRYKINGWDYDVLRVACLIHDLPYSIYYDKELDIYRTDYNHPFLNAIYLSSITQNKLLIASVYYHMGIWADYDSKIAYELYDLSLEELRDYSVVLATQEADYYSSRRDIMVTGWYC